jgi:hypothetical protein
MIEASCFALAHLLRKDMKLCLTGSPAKYSGLKSRFWEHIEVRLELLGTQVVVSMMPKSSQRKYEGGPRERQSPTFVVPDDVEKIAEQEHAGVSEVGIRDPSVRQVMF